MGEGNFCVGRAMPAMITFFDYIYEIIIRISLGNLMLRINSSDVLYWLQIHIFRFFDIMFQKVNILLKIT